MCCFNFPTSSYAHDPHDPDDGWIDWYETGLDFFQNNSDNR